jgi:hypothetical protein
MSNGSHSNRVTVTPDRYFPRPGFSAAEAGHQAQPAAAADCPGWRKEPRRVPIGPRALSQLCPQPRGRDWVQLFANSN